MSLREALLDPDSDFRSQMNESWRSFLSSRTESDAEKRETVESKPADSGHPDK